MLVLNGESFLADWSAAASHPSDVAAQPVLGHPSLDVRPIPNFLAQ